MFGGLAFMVAGNMACGVIGDDLLVRVGRDDYAATSGPAPRPGRWSFRGRTMGGFVVVDAEGVAEDDDLGPGWSGAWLRRSASLPPK